MKQLISISFLLCVLLVGNLLCKAQSIKEALIEKKADSLLTLLSLDEKIGQTNQRGTSSRSKGELTEELKAAIKKGAIGSMLNIPNRDMMDDIQKIALKESPHGIPLIFARDVIHGYKTIFPIPLGLAAGWNSNLVEKTSAIASEEATTAGIR